MAQISFYGEAHCGDCGATWEFEPMDEGDILHSDHECGADGTSEESE